MRKTVIKVLTVIMTATFIFTSNMQIAYATNESEIYDNSTTDGVRENGDSTQAENDINTIASPQSEQPTAGQVYLNDPLDNPVPVIYSYEVVGDGAITPGEEFTLKFTVYNPAVVSNVGNIRIEVFQDNGLVYPIYGKTNSVYLGYLNTLSYTDGELNLVASKSINDEEIPITIRLVYTDNYTTERAQNLYASLPVSTSGKLIVNSVDIPSAMYVGTNNRMSVTYSNNGLSTVNDLILHISGSKIEESEVDLGSMGSSSSVTSDIYVSFLQAGDQTIKLYFTYTDRDGNSQKTEPVNYKFKVNDYTAASETENANDTQNISKINMFISLFILFISIGFLMFMLGRNKGSKKASKRIRKGKKA